MWRSLDSIEEIFAETLLGKSDHRFTLGNLTSHISHLAPYTISATSAKYPTVLQICARTNTAYNELFATWIEFIWQFQQQFAWITRQSRHLTEIKFKTKVREFECVWSFSIKGHIDFGRENFNCSTKMRFMDLTKQITVGSYRFYGMPIRANYDQFSIILFMLNIRNIIG